MERWRAALEIKRRLDLLRRQPSGFEYEPPAKDAVDDDGRWYVARLRELTSAMNEFASAGEIGKALLVAQWIGALAREWHVAPALTFNRKIEKQRERGNRTKARNAESNRLEARQMVAGEMAANPTMGRGKAVEIVAAHMGKTPRWVYAAMRPEKSTEKRKRCSVVRTSIP